MIFQCETYRDILNSILVSKIEENPLYSANSFAKKLGISQSYLSLILNGKRSISDQLAFSMGQNLNFNDLEKDYFLLLIRKENAPSSDLYKYYEEKIQELRRKNNVDYLDIEKFQVISDWHYSAILESINLTGIEPSPSVLAKKLNISIDIVNKALNKLVRLNLIKKENDKYIRTDKGFLTTPPEIKSMGLRKFHKQILKKAINAIDTQEIDERYVSGITMAIDNKKIPEAKRRIQKFMEELMEFLEDGEKNEVYQLSTQLFRLEGNKDFEGRALKDGQPKRTPLEREE